MRKLIYFLLLITTAVQAQIAPPDSTQQIPGQSFTPQFRFYGQYAADGINQFRNPSNNKWFSIYSTFQTNKLLNAKSDTGRIIIYAIGGQSNAQARGDTSQSPKLTSAIAIQYVNNSVRTANDPIGPLNSSMFQGSEWPAFAIRRYQLTGEKIGLVQSAVGGSSQVAAAAGANGTWDTSGTLYGTMLLRIDSAMTAFTNLGYKPVFGGVLWSQGEQDADAINAGTITGTDYYNRAKIMFQNFKTHFGANTPIYVIRTGRKTSTTNNGYDTVRVRQEQLAFEGYIIIADRNSNDYVARGMMASTIHWSQAGLNEAGINVANTVVGGNRDAMYKLAPGQTNRPSLVLPYGKKLTTYIAGAFENDSTNLFASANATRKRISLIPQNGIKPGALTFGGTDRNLTTDSTGANYDSANKRIVLAGTDPRYRFYDVSQTNPYLDLRYSSGNFRVEVRNSSEGLVYTPIQIGPTGSLRFNNGFQTNATLTNANLFSSSNGLEAGITEPALLFPGSSILDTRVGMRGSATPTLTSNANYGTFSVGASIVAANGTNPLTYQVGIRPLTITGSGTATRGASLYIQGATSGASSNYALLIDAGDVNIGGLTASLPVKTDANKSLVSGAINLSGSEVTGTLPITRGGTGLSTLGTANQLLRVNSGATALEYFTPNYALTSDTSTFIPKAWPSGYYTATGNRRWTGEQLIQNTGLSITGPDANFGLEGSQALNTNFSVSNTASNGDGPVFTAGSAARATLELNNYLGQQAFRFYGDGGLQMYNTKTGTAGTDSILVKDASTSEIKRIAANYYATSTGLVDNQLTKTADYTIVSGDFAAGKKTTLDLYVDATAGNVTITLPTYTSFVGYTIYVTKTDATANTVTINTVVGANTLVTQYQSRQFNSAPSIGWVNH